MLGRGNRGEFARLAGEFGTLEPGELLCELFPGDDSESEGVYCRRLFGDDRCKRPDDDAAT